MKLDLITNKAEIVNGVNKNDEFYTPLYAILPIIKYLKPGSLIYCPFDGEQSNYVKLLRERGFNVIHGHIFDGNDFFIETAQSLSEVDYIISNPPYSIKGKVFEHLFSIGKPFAMLVGVVGLFESKSRFEMFRDNMFEIMFLSKRVSYFKDYSDQSPSLNPPFSSIYLCSGILPDRIVFEEIDKSK